MSLHPLDQRCLDPILQHAARHYRVGVFWTQTGPRNEYVLCCFHAPKDTDHLPQHFLGYVGPSSSEAERDALRAQIKSTSPRQT